MYYKMIVFEANKQLLEYFDKYLEGTKEIKVDAYQKEYKLYLNSLEDTVTRISIPKGKIRNVMFVPDNYFNGDYEKYMERQYIFIKYLMDGNLLDSDSIIL